jgi:hypothetical protein
MMQRIECPLCRKELAEISDDEEEDEDLGEEDTDDDESDDESDDEGEEGEGGEGGEGGTEEECSESGLHPIDNSITCKQATQKMKDLGYTAEDIMYLLVGRLDPREKPKYKRAFRDEMEHDLHHILSGDIQVDYRDSRTYAQVMAGNARQEEAGIGPKIVAHNS